MDYPAGHHRRYVRCDCGQLVGSYQFQSGTLRFDDDGLVHDNRGWHFEDYAGRWYLDPLTSGPLNVHCKGGHPCEITPTRAAGAIASGVRTIRLPRG